MEEDIYPWCQGFVVTGLLKDYYYIHNKFDHNVFNNFGGTYDTVVSEKIISICIEYTLMPENWIHHLHQHPHGEHIRGEMVDLL